MFGHDWRPGEATIVDMHILSTHGGSFASREYAADVSVENEAPFRATIQEPNIQTDWWRPGIGDVVRVLVDPKSQKVKFDKSDPKLSARAQERTAKERFQASAAGAPGPAGALDPARAEMLAELKARVAAASSPGTNADPAERLAKLQSLRDKDLIDDDQFERQRQRILDSI